MAPTVVRIGDTEFRDGDGILLKASVSLAEGKERTTAEFSLADPLMEIATAIPLPSEDSKVPVEVFAGEKVFAGYLTNLTHAQSSKSPGKLTLQASDTLSEQRKSSGASVLTDASAAQQLQIIAADAGKELVFQGDSEDQLNQVQYGQRVQRGISDAAFMGEMLEALGHTYQVRGDTLYIRAVGAEDETSPVELRMGSDGTVSSTVFRVKELDRATTPNVYSRAGNLTFEQDLRLDPHVQERAVRLERTGILFEATDLPSFTDQTLEQASNAQARAKKIFTGHVVLNGLDTRIDVDRQVLLRGLGGRFTGIWNVEKVTHNLSPLRETSFDVYNGGGNDSGGRISFIGDQILFDFDVDTFGPEYEAVVDRVAARLSLYDQTVVVITGHADEVGTDAYNLDLGLRRAQSVYDALLARGIEASRMSIQSKGESEPVSSDNALNRRVNFVIK